MFQIDTASRIPIFEQIVNSVISLAAAGVLKPHDKIPPVRVLAQQIGVNPNTVARAYRELERKGYLYSNVGRGSFISEKLREDTTERQKAKRTVKDAAMKAMEAGVTEVELKKVIEDVFRGGNAL